MHKCQGFGQLLALPGSFSVKYQLADTTIPGQAAKDETDLLDGLDLSLPGLARFAGPTPPARLVDGLSQIADAVDAASRRAASAGQGQRSSPHWRAGMSPPGAFVPSCRGSG